MGAGEGRIYGMHGSQVFFVASRVHTTSQTCYTPVEEIV